MAGGEGSVGSCKVCGRPLPDGKRRKYCSEACNYQGSLERQREYSREWRTKNKGLFGPRPEKYRKACQVCGGEVPRPRKKYCSDKCYWIAIGRLSELVHGEAKPGRNNTGWRECLKCGGQFRSSGPENRLCPGCHTKNQKWLDYNGDTAIFNPVILVEL